MRVHRRRVVLPCTKVGFIQKLPTQLVAAFRATLEELGESTLLLHVVDVSSPNAAAQTDTVLRILRDLQVNVPIVTVWNKVRGSLPTGRNSFIVGFR